MNTAKKILLVDDDIDFLVQIQTRLKAQQYDVITAEGQQDAEKILAETKPDLAILDLMMEQVDGGFALAYHLKQKYPDVPIILCTAVASETGIEFDASTDEERSWIKADVFLPKPVRFEQLAREIERLLQDKA
ncbi:MAG: response regulator [Candidatus Marinimicrobia bacterium]|jgi:two-component system OmpR family response regulator|nr:response regulator [Candidatus Neomarinimicrobiota bacterium]MCK9482939.1 response regulator [Candidatus Neomarinimicrobiota bacterium]MCK9559038.1 response regulator [Candidatus Neomarinimicrobiota bacterium]MDD5061606.1 response regulator [Candidatus Neomarinimicrobiota bacterium]MDD5230592.1 response regulator [Candidatus Neomarinimicrobiota bacterium]